MERPISIDQLCFCILLVVGCAEQSLPEHDTTAGTGGSNTGPTQTGVQPQLGGAVTPSDAGAATSPQRGESCDPGPLLPDAPSSCAPARRDFLGQCKRRFEGEQCYVAAVDSACMPAREAQRIEGLTDFIASAGFQSEFVLDTAPTAELPASCDQVVACCQQVEPDYQRTRCYDQVDDSERAVFCGTNTPDELARAYGCDVGSADAGAPEVEGATSASWKLCCYRVCGYVQDT